MNWARDSVVGTSERDKDSQRVCLVVPLTPIVYEIPYNAKPMLI